MGCRAFRFVLSFRQGNVCQGQKRQKFLNYFLPNLQQWLSRLGGATLRRASLMQTVHYPGAGWDDSFLRVPEFQDVKRFVLYDILPTQGHHCPCHPVNEKNDTPEHFFQTLHDTFGPPLKQTRHQLIFRRNGKTIHYHPHRDATHLDLSRRPNDAIYLCGMNPYHVKTQRPIFINCNTTYFVDHHTEHRRKHRFHQVHTPQDDQPCYCVAVEKQRHQHATCHPRSRLIRGKRIRSIQREDQILSHNDRTGLVQVHTLINGRLRQVERLAPTTTPSKRPKSRKM